MTKVPSLDHCIALICDCGHRTAQMTQDELDQFGTPWYCPQCGRQMLRFKIGLMEASISPHLTIQEVMRQVREDLKAGIFYESKEMRDARILTLSRFKKS